MSAYTVSKDGHSFYIMPFDVETYVRKGYTLYKEQEKIIDDIDAETAYINDTMTSAYLEYWAKKDGIGLRIQPFRIREFYDRGYQILTKNLVKVDDTDAEIEKINSSDDILPLGYE